MKDNFKGLNDFKTQLNSVENNATLGHPAELNRRLRESCAMLCQLSYEGRC